MFPCIFPKFNVWKVLSQLRKDKYKKIFSNIISKQRRRHLETEENDTKKGAEGIVSPSFLMTGASRCHQNFGTKKRYTAN